MNTESPETTRERARAVVRSTREFMEELVQVRRDSKLRQEDVAERMAVSQPTVAAIERYDANPTLSTIERYAIAVGARLVLRARDERGGDWTATSTHALHVPRSAADPARPGRSPNAVPRVYESTLRVGTWDSLEQHYSEAS